MFSFFFFNDTATTEIYTLSLHDALPISLQRLSVSPRYRWSAGALVAPRPDRDRRPERGRVRGRPGGRPPALRPGARPLRRGLRRRGGQPRPQGAGGGGGGRRRGGGPPRSPATP